MLRLGATFTSCFKFSDIYYKQNIHYKICICKTVMTGTLLQYVNEEMLYTITTSKRKHTNCQSRLILSHRPISTFIDVKLLELGRLNVPIHLIVGSIIPIILRTAF